MFGVSLTGPIKRRRRASDRSQPARRRRRLHSGDDAGRQLRAGERQSIDSDDAIEHGNQSAVRIVRSTRTIR